MRLRSANGGGPVAGRETTIQTMTRTMMPSGIVTETRTGTASPRSSFDTVRPVRSSTSDAGKAPCSRDSAAWIRRSRSWAMTVPRPPASARWRVGSPLIRSMSSRYRTREAGTMAHRIAAFDLALCLEVAEHIPSWHSGKLLTMLAGARRLVFSAAVPNQGGQLHVNEQPDALLGRPSFGPRLEPGAVRRRAEVRTAIAGAPAVVQREHSRVRAIDDTR